MNRERVFRMYLLYTGASALFFALMSTVSAVYFIETVHLTAFELLMVGFVLEATIFLLQMPTGVMADLYSRKLSMTIGLVLIGTGFALEGLVPDFTAILAAQALWGAGYTFVSGADQAWIADEMGNDGLETVFLRGAQVDQACTLVGIVLSVVLANVQLSLPMVCSGLLYIGFAVVVWLTFPEHRTVRVVGTDRPTWRSSVGTVGEGLRVIRGSTVLGLMIVIGCLSGLYSEGFDRLWALHLLQSFTLPAIGHLHQVVWFGMISAVALVLNILAVEWLSRQFARSGRLDQVWILSALNALLSVGIVVFAMSTHLWPALAAYWLCQVLRGTNSPLYSAMLNQQIQGSTYRATILSAQEQLYSLGEIFGGPLVGLVVARTSVVAGLITSGIIAAPICLLYLWTGFKAKRCVPQGHNA